MIVALILFVLFSILFLGVPIAFGLGSLGLGLMPVSYTHLRAHET